MQAPCSSKDHKKNSDLSYNISFLARLLTNNGNGTPVIFKPDSKEFPTEIGKGYHWTTPGGKPIRCPNAYKWPKVYHNSTRRIIVGGDWMPKVPKGMKLSFNIHGCLLVRQSDGMDLHFEPRKLYLTKFCSWARKEMATNYLNRIKTRKLERDKRVMEQKLTENLANTRVTLEDSRRAGNCAVGSLTFGKYQFNLTEEEITKFNFNFPAKLLWRTNDERAKAAVRQAFLRETIVTI